MFGPYRIRLSIVVTVAVSVLASLLGAAPTTASANDPLAAEYPDGPPGKQKSVPGRKLKVKPQAPDSEDAPPPSFPKPVWPDTDVAEVDLSGANSSDLVKVDSSVLRLGPAGKERALPESVRVVTHNRAASDNIGTDGPIFELINTGKVAKPGRVKLTVDYSKFWHAHSGNFADRLHLVALPACGLKTPANPTCQKPVPVDTHNDGEKRELSAEVPVASAGPSVYAVTAGAAGTGTGDYKATKLNPAGQWVAGQQSGSFGYTYPIQPPPAPYGTTPKVEFTYDSGSVDGRTSASNNQSSWVGMGWEYHPGFIERKYKSCPADGKKDVGDLCWDSPYKGKDDGAVYNISLNGKHTELLWDGSHYRMRDDQNWRIQHKFDGPLPGKQQEYWIVTTPDGTRYFFGYGKDRSKTNGAATNSNWTVPVVGNDSGEPGGSKGTDMPYRWNLDYVIDPNENATAYFWTTETNHYKSLADDEKIRSYVSGGVLKRIEYGLRGDHPDVQAPAKVTFTSYNRCKERNTVEDPFDDPPPACPTIKSSPSSYPDIPTDAICGASSCSEYSPTFFLRDRLDKITTYVAELDGEGWDTAGIYQMKFAYPQTDDGTDPALWLNWIRRIGGTIGGGTDNYAKEPVTDFNGTNFNNRVDTSASNKALSMRRITTVQNTLGADTQVTYGRQNKCSNWGSKDWAKNNQDCFRVWFVPDGADDGEWGVFNKYLVKKVVEVDRVGGNPDQTTKYEYLYGAGWHFDDDLSAKVDRQSWSDWRGYKTVEAVKGTSSDLSQRSASRSTFFRGLHNDRLNRANTEKRTETSADYNGKEHTDHHYLANRPLQTRTGQPTEAGNVTSETVQIHEYWNSGVTADGPGFHNAHMIREEKVTGLARNLDRSWRTTELTRTFDKQGFATKELDKGDLDVASDDKCTTTRYARNTSGWRWMLSYPAVVTLKKATCDGGNHGQTVTLYDGSDSIESNIPTDGNPTTTQEYSNSQAFTQTTKEYDTFGRIIRETKPNGTASQSDDTTTTVYDPPVGWPHKGVTVFQPPIDGQQLSTITWASRRDGAAVKTRDANNRVTQLDYDTLGRLTDVWLPTEPKPADGSEGSPSKKFTYVTPYNGIKAPYAPTRVTSQRWQAGPANVPKWNASHTYLDGLGREIETQTTSPFDREQGRLVEVTRYDNRGLKRFETGVPIYNANLSGSGVLNPDEQAIPSRTVYSYDFAERETRSALWQGATEKWATTTRHAANLKIVDPPTEGRVATWTNAQDKTTAVDDDYAPSMPGNKTKYTYTLRGELASITDFNGNTSRYEYDWHGRRLETDDPDAGTSRNSYDAAGNLVSTTDGAGKKISFSYDALNRKTGQFAGDPGSGTRLATWTYDTAPGGKGELAKATRHIGGNDYVTQVLGYDDGGRPTGSKLIIPSAEGELAGTYSIGYGYDRAGRQNTITYPAAGGLPAETVTTNFSEKSGAIKNLASDWGGGTRYVKNTLYWGTGQIVERHVGATGSWARRYEYETATGRLAELFTDRGVDTDNRTHLQSDDFAYDQVGNLTRITDRAVPTDGGGVTDQHQCFTYDTTDRLTKAWTTVTNACSDGPDGADKQGPEPYKLGYVYTRSGNLERVTDGDATHVYSYPDSGNNAVRPHAVSKITTTGPNGGGGTTTTESTFKYDPVGQMTERTVDGDTTSLGWDQLDQLTEATVDGKKTSFVYDADGDRILRRDPDATTLYLDGMELKKTASGVAATRYYSTGDTLVAARTTSGITWLFNDPHSSVSLAVDNTTGKAQRQRYRPFGAHRGKDAITVTERDFLGKTKDPTTGLVATDERYYDPAIGRFISPDPVIKVDEPQQHNPYSYANNNPTTYSDPSGLDACDTRACPGDPGHDEPPVWDSWDPRRNSDGSPGQDSYFSRSLGRTGAIIVPKGISYFEFRRLFDKWYALTVGNRTNQPHIAQLRDELNAAMNACRELKECRGHKSGWWLQLAMAHLEVGMALGMPIAGSGGRGRGGGIRAGRGGRPQLGRINLGRMPNLRSLLCGRNSFTTGTKVVLANGKRKPIEKIKLGDKVLATDPKTGETKAAPVTGLITGNGAKSLIKIKVDEDGAPNLEDNNRDGGVIATSDHPFWVENLQQWVSADKLAPGMWLRTSSGTVAQVSAVNGWTARPRVHNLTIDDVHTYHVAAGRADTLVHNGCPTGLRDASTGLRGIFGGGSVQAKSIIGIRATLLKHGFTRHLARNRSGYLYRNDLGEEVRIMRRNGAWDVRIRNKFNNYLDEWGNVATPDQTHGIHVYSR